MPVDGRYADRPRGFAPLIDRDCFATGVRERAPTQTAGEAFSAANATPEEFGSEQTQERGAWRVLCGLRANLESLIRH